MRANKVDVGLGNGTHADLVIGPRQEARESTDEHHLAVTASATDADANQVLLSDEALDEAVGEGILVGDGEGGVLGVSIQSNHVGVVLSKLDQGSTVRYTGGNLK